MSGATERIKNALSSYGRMLKDTYIPNHKKKQIRVSMKKLERELKTLEKEEKIANMQHRIAKTRANISRLNQQNRGKSGVEKVFDIIAGGGPDYLGTGNKNSRGNKAVRAGKKVYRGMNFDLDWKW